MPTHQEVFANGAPSFSALGGKLDHLISDWDFNEFRSDVQKNLLDKIESNDFNFSDKRVDKIKLASFTPQHLDSES